MEEKYKRLLLIDLCERLPYSVKVYNITFKDPEIQTLFGRISYDEFIMKETYKRVEGDDFQIVKEGVHYSGRLECIKPYLRSMSSMTEEEKIEYYSLCYDEEREEFECGEWVTKVYFHDTIESIDWLLAHHFDCHDLIPLGLALEAPEDMYQSYGERIDTISKREFNG